jgi:hypothetical protein
MNDRLQCAFRRDERLASLDLIDGAHGSAK